jgi:hypothetical protein
MSGHKPCTKTWPNAPFYGHDTNSWPRVHFRTVRAVPRQTCQKRPKTRVGHVERTKSLTGHKTCTKTWPNAPFYGRDTNLWPRVHFWTVRAVPRRTCQNRVAVASNRTKKLTARRNPTKTRPWHRVVTITPTCDKGSISRPCAPCRAGLAKNVRRARQIGPKSYPRAEIRPKLDRGTELWPSHQLVTKGPFLDRARRTCQNRVPGASNRDQKANRRRSIS